MIIVENRTAKFMGKTFTISVIISDKGKLVKNINTEEVKPNFYGKNTEDYIEIDASIESYNKRQEYESKVEELIRKKYTVSQEFSVQRQKEKKPKEYDVYNSYCEECKNIARRDVYGH